MCDEGSADRRYNVGGRTSEHVGSHTLPVTRVLRLMVFDALRPSDAGGDQSLLCARRTSRLLARLGPYSLTLAARKNSDDPQALCRRYRPMSASVLHAVGSAALIEHRLENMRWEYRT